MEEKISLSLWLFSFIAFFRFVMASSTLHDSSPVSIISVLCGALLTCSSKDVLRGASAELCIAVNQNNENRVLLVLFISGDLGFSP